MSVYLQEVGHCIARRIVPALTIRFSLFSLLTRARKHLHTQALACFLPAFAICKRMGVDRKMNCFCVRVKVRFFKGPKVNKIEHPPLRIPDKVMFRTTRTYSQEDM